ncbi:hypothetical protein DUNSADRAFT_10563 [Dunaliella salina]|uniref:SPX domain-containing protein n=1 Tax=Dunaliella salina TaxID=3046 RepID=A0ABQ7H4S5_DUNSA|nr:hypothetical protein DUNSADRAFT_10563 [Dunaliella salina]|eukprot:KAF5841857.1 hypothetical protein DUNSADRAFT_10563 [Dunaliella salina]
MFLRYKELKKQLKSIPRRDENAGLCVKDRGGHLRRHLLSLCPHASAGKHSTSKLSSEELKFIGTLNEDLGKFNRFFMEQEEEAVIQLQALTDELASQQGGATSIQLKERLVQFHGSCVMLMHWSLLNYAAVAKILKKHDKRTGLLLRAPCLTNVLQQPFNNTSVMSRLVKRAEEQLLKVTPPATTAGFGKRLMQQHSQPLQQQQQQQQYHIISAPSNKALARSPGSGPTAAAAAASGKPASGGCTPAGEAADSRAAPSGAADSEQPGAHAALHSMAQHGSAPQLHPQQPKQPSPSPQQQQQQQQQQQHEPHIRGAAAPLEVLAPVPYRRSVSVEEEAAGAAAAAAAAVGDGEAAAAEGGAATAVAAAAGGGGMTHHALRALEMWKTLQATASTPSTVVPEGSSQPTSLASGAVQLPPHHHHHQLHSHSRDSQPLPLDTSSRGEKRAREEVEPAHPQPHSCHTHPQQPQNPSGAGAACADSPRKKQSREVEQGV